MHSGRVVIMDSGFCVLQALIGILLVGFYSFAVIKKRRYWAKYIDGEASTSISRQKWLVNVTLFQVIQSC
jgi:hypothetical protein